jgi:phytoene dehydrogenase-like protein
VSGVQRYDALVIGAGFGGIATALTLAEQGAKVLLCEALTYPGGCASTFTRKGWRFEAGATLFSGFGEGQIMRRWIERHGLDVHVDLLDPTIEVRTPAWTLPVPTDRATFTERLCALPGVPRDAASAFLREQAQVADALWALFDDPALLPPFDARALLTHLSRVPRYLPLLRLVNRPLIDVLRRHGLQGSDVVRTWLDAFCQITVQCGVAQAEAPFALAATDYCFRGTGHVRGGVGVLAQALCDAIVATGGEVRFASRVSALAREPGGWVATVRGVPVHAARVVANLLPHQLAALTGAEGAPALDGLARDVDAGWSACMLYLGVDADAPAHRAAHHLELIVDPTAPLVEGNHLFASVSDASETDRAPDGRMRTVTVSTHVPLARWRESTPAQRATWIEDVHARMDAGLARLAPELSAGIRFRMTASPRTWERFTRRANGAVGGIPRRAGWHNYAQLGPLEVARGLWMVGDTAFPGQSTLATALGGIRTAQTLARA